VASWPGGTPNRRRYSRLAFPFEVNRFAGRLAFPGTTVDGQTWEQHPALAAATARY